MINVDKILGQILNSGQGKALAGGLLVGGLAGAMTGKSGKKIAKTALKLGGAAAVAGLAYTAYQRYRANQGQPGQAGPGQVQSAPAYSAPAANNLDRDDIIDIRPLQQNHYLPPPNDTQAMESLSLKLIRAMISAAKADGQIDTTETDRIFGQINAFGLNDEERSFLLAELNKPMTARQIADTASCPEEAAEIYAVSVMAVNPNGLAERLYLGDLSRLLKLEPALAQTIHDRVLSGAE